MQRKSHGKCDEEKQQDMGKMASPGNKLDFDAMVIKTL